MSDAFRVISFAERYDDELEEQRWQIVQAGWKRFMLEDNIANAFYDRFYRDFRPFLFGLYDPSDEATLIAFGESIPITWDGTIAGLPEGWDAALQMGCEARTPPNTLCAISINVSPAHRGSHVSRQAILAMRAIAQQAGFKNLIAPVRPNFEDRYPLTPMARYIQWTHEDGKAPFDPWLRTHWRLGARILGVCERSMVIRHPVADWEGWTDLRFPDSGTYVVPGALAPIQVDREQDIAEYIEPNVWMQHTLV